MGSLDAWKVQPSSTRVFSCVSFSFKCLLKYHFASRTMLSTPSLAPFAYHQPVLMTQRPSYLDGIITSNSCQKFYCLKVRGTGEKELLAPLLGSKNPFNEPESCVFKAHPRRTHIDNFGRWHGVAGESICLVNFLAINSAMNLSRPESQVLCGRCLVRLCQ
jgi:hypothetical protein